jgi:hypothetical protein
MTQIERDEIALNHPEMSVIDHLKFVDSLEEKRIKEWMDMKTKKLYDMKMAELVARGH